MTSDALLIDVGSTYFKVHSSKVHDQYFRDFNKSILDDLTMQCGDLISLYSRDDVYVCSSANGGLSALIIGLTNSFSLKYAINIAFNSGINIIDTVLYANISEASVPSDTVDVVIIVGGIDSSENGYDKTLLSFVKKINYSNIVYAGSSDAVENLSLAIDDLVVLKNIVDHKLHVNEDELMHYLTDLYKADIMGKEDVKCLYDITANQIFPTPYVVNKALPLLSDNFAVADPYILIDIGGATTDIHYSKDLVSDNMLVETEYDRLVFKKLGVFKSRESLVFAAKKNEFVYELLSFLRVTENILLEQSKKSEIVLMQLAIFLVLCKVSSFNNSHVTLNLNSLNSIVLTGGVTKVLEPDDIEKVILFFYKKTLNSDHNPRLVLDCEYKIWTLGMFD